jgi:hypothetical protein
MTSPFTNSPHNPALYIIDLHPAIEGGLNKNLGTGKGYLGAWVRIHH